MKYLIRYIELPYWNFNYSEPEIPFEAKPLADLRIDTSNKISTFIYDDEVDDLERIMLGKVLKRANPNVLHYVKLELEDIESAYNVTKKLGTTDIDESNEAHRDVLLGSAIRAIEFAKLLYSKIKSPNYSFVKEKDVRTMVFNAVESGLVSRNDLNDALKKVYDKKKVAQGTV